MLISIFLTALVFVDAQRGPPGPPGPPGAPGRPGRCPSPCENKQCEPACMMGCCYPEDYPEFNKKETKQKEEKKSIIILGEPKQVVAKKNKIEVENKSTKVKDGKKGQMQNDKKVKKVEKVAEGMKSKSNKAKKEETKKKKVDKNSKKRFNHF